MSDSISIAQEQDEQFFRKLMDDLIIKLMPLVAYSSKAQLYGCPNL